MLKERKFEREFVIDVEILSGERKGRVILCLQESWRKSCSCSCERRNLISSLQFILIGG